jgi:glycosidase
MWQIELFAQKTPPPTWAKNAIWYQIFVERFHNADKSNDPKPENANIPPIGMNFPQDWSITDWEHSWYEQEEWAKKLGKFNHTVSYRRYGGDLQGIIDKLDYLQSLGVNALFLNPINDAPSLHKYDARNYHHIDVNFGPDPTGDMKLIAQENPNNPDTWQWTSADKLFLKLVEEAHKRGMKIIMDYSWNHTGTMHWAWQDILKNQEKSPYKDWYSIKSFDNLATPQNEFDCEGWLGNKTLPEIRKVNITTPRKVGYPYEGDINEEAKKHIFAVTKRWLAPNGEVGKGVDGYRLDVADQIGLVFWRDFRQFVRNIQPEAYLVGEIWWQEWPDNLMNPVPYTSGDIFDAVMFYQVYRPARYFFAKTNYDINAKQFSDSLQFQWNRLSPEVRQAMMNVATSHDTPRLLSDFANPNKYKFKATPNDDANYNTNKPTEESYKRLRLYLVHTFTSVGAPHIWNGEEMGMWGADDPDCRKPLMWKELKFKPEKRVRFKKEAESFDEVKFNEEHFKFYQKLIKIRKENPILATGEFKFLATEGKLLAYQRTEVGKEGIIVVFNAGAESQKYTLPTLPKKGYTDLLTNQKINKKSITLKPFSAMILR